MGRTRVDRSPEEKWPTTARVGLLLAGIHFALWSWFAISADGKSLVISFARLSGHFGLGFRRPSICGQLFTAPTHVCPSK
jgi:hypothetical protein